MKMNLWALLVSVQTQGLEIADNEVTTGLSFASEWLGRCVKYFVSNLRQLSRL